MYFLFVLSSNFLDYSHLLINNFIIGLELRIFPKSLQEAIRLDYIPRPQIEDTFFINDVFLINIIFLFNSLWLTFIESMLWDFSYLLILLRVVISSKPPLNILFLFCRKSFELVIKRSSLLMFRLCFLHTVFNWETNEFPISLIKLIIESILLERSR